MAMARRRFNVGMNASAVSCPPFIENVVMVGIRLTHINQIVRWNIEGRDTIVHREPTEPRFDFFFQIPLEILPPPTRSTVAQQYILLRLLPNVNGDTEPCDSVVPEIFAFDRSVANSSRRSFFLSVSVEVLSTDLIEEVTEGPTSIFEWLSSWIILARDGDVGVDGCTPSSVVERLRKERKLDASEGVAVDGRELGNCAICLDDMSGGGELIDMRCRHIFREHWVFQWLKTHNTCPTCRQTVE